MKLSLLGVRGSTPAPGQDFVRYGGHTSCVAVTAHGQDLPSLVLDAGTGIRSLSRLLPGPGFQGSILLSHLHWDHVLGVPFFVAGDNDASVVDVYLPAQNGMTGRDLFASFMSPPRFPIEPEGLRGTWTFTTLEPGRTTIGDFAVTAVQIAHKGGRTFGYRVDDGDLSVAYLPDHAPVNGVSDELRSMLQGVDVMLHDAQFLESERKIADLFGHATIPEAVALATEAQVGTLVLFHHGPARTDDQLDAIACDLVDAPVRVVLAVEGQDVQVGDHAR